MEEKIRGSYGDSQDRDELDLSVRVLQIFFDSLSIVLVVSGWRDQFFVTCESRVHPGIPTEMIRFLFQRLSRKGSSRVEPGDKVLGHGGHDGGE